MSVHNSARMLLADRAPKLVRKLSSDLGISEAPAKIIAFMFAAASAGLGLNAVAGVKLTYRDQLCAEAVLGHEHFHNVRIVSFRFFWSWTLAEHARYRKCARHLELRGRFRLVIF